MTPAEAAESMDTARTKNYTNEGNTMTLVSIVEGTGSFDDKRRARNLVRAEYGDSTNFMTPEVVGCVLLAPNVAAEISKGRGMRRENGERPEIVGISIVRREEDGSTTRLTMQSGVLVDPTPEDVSEVLDEISRSYPDEVPTWEVGG